MGNGEGGIRPEGRKKQKSTSILKWRMIMTTIFLISIFVSLIISIILINKKYDKEEDTNMNTTAKPSITEFPKNDTFPSTTTEKQETSTKLSGIRPTTESIENITTSSTTKEKQKTSTNLSEILTTESIENITTSSTTTEKQKTSTNLSDKLSKIKYNENVMPLSTTTEKYETSTNLSELAEKILKNMDQSVNPCDNFYQFACGGFINSTVIPKGKNRVTSISIAKDQIQEQLKIILEQSSLSHELRPFKLAKNYYKICMDETAIEKQGLGLLQKIIKRLGGWPVLEGDKWNENEFDWIRATFAFENMGIPVDYFIFVDFDIYAPNVTSQYILAYLKSAKDLIPVKKDFVKIAIKLGADEHSALTQFNETKEFSYKLAAINSSLEVGYPTKMLKLTKDHPNIPWENLFNFIFSLNPSIEKNEKVVVCFSEYIKNLENLLMNTDKKIIANYMTWMAIKNITKFLNEDIRQTDPEYTKINRWEECVDEVSKTLPFAVGAFYIRKYFPENDKKFADEMVITIRDQFYQILSSNSWMDGETKKYAIKKAKLISNHIAYSDELLNDSKLEKYYDGLEVNENSYLEAHLDLLKFKRSKYFALLREPIKKKFEWMILKNPTVVDESYSVTQNNIEITAGYLQSIFFNENWPKYINYGAIGNTIGHVITHGYDLIGRNIGENRADVKWTRLANEKYQKKDECFIQQYQNYTTKDRQFDANKMLNENIADNGGIQISYSAYINWLKKNGEDEKLPNINWSSKQMFWISAANSRCSLYKSEEMEKVLNTEIHSPDELRIIGSFSNMPEFANDFNCPIGSPMNPVKKCSFW